MKKFTMPSPPEPSFAQQPSLKIEDAVPADVAGAGADRRYQPVAPLDAAFIGRTYITLTWFGLALTLCTYLFTKSLLITWSFAVAVAFAGILLKSQEMLVRRVVRPKDAPPYEGWDAGISLPLWFLVKYALVASVLWSLYQHHLLNLIVFATGFMIAQFAVVSKILGRFLQQRSPSIRQSYVKPAVKGTHRGLIVLAALFCFSGAGVGHAQSAAAPAAGSSPIRLAQDNNTPDTAPKDQVAVSESAAPGGEAEHAKGTFEAEYGTWIHPIAQLVFGTPPPALHDPAHPEEGYDNVGYDFAIVALLAALGIAIAGISAGKQVKLRPEGKPNSLANVVETLADSFRDYVISVMGKELGQKYTPLIGSYFFTIIVFNWMGLIPGLLAPTSNPNIPIGFALVAFFAVHIIAIREAGIKSWFMHFVGEPLWLAPLNLPLHIIGEFIKPMSLAIRLLCNVFGEEMIVAKIAGLALLIAAALHMPAIIPLQLPFMLLGLFFGFLQALVFSTLVAIYISILSTSHDAHDDHNVHGNVEHVHVRGFDEVVAHPSETPVA